MTSSRLKAVLKFADAAAKNPMFVDTAYTMYNQPIEPQYDHDLLGK